MKGVLELWFGLTREVDRKAYALSGFSLILVKYVVEAGLTWGFAGAILTPWNFLNPVFTIRTEQLRSGPEWLPWVLFLWTLPFLWIAISMSVRRSADTGASPWLGLMVLVPVVNLFYMVYMCLVPSAGGKHWRPESDLSKDEKNARSAAYGIGISLIVGGVMMFVSVYWFATYGASLFIGTPMLMGATASYFHNRNHSRSQMSSIGVGLGSVLFAAVALLLFALEGLICVAMATPLVLPLGALGGILGKAIADATARPQSELAAAVLMLPMLCGIESFVTHKPEYEVVTSVEIDAPAEEVWQHVVQFPELPPADEWFFRLGIACPEGARIEGTGVGATRYCEFSTGTFVEPITAWEEPRRLAFDVIEQPSPMFELSPFENIHPPHLHGYLTTVRGEFRLIPTPEGRTRLEGRTWYFLKMYPQGYWTLWSDLVIHRIHERVLEHVKDLSEERRIGESEARGTKRRSFWSANSMSPALLACCADRPGVESLSHVDVIIGGPRGVADSFPLTRIESAHAHDHLPASHLLCGLYFLYDSYNCRVRSCVGSKRPSEF